MHVLVTFSLHLNQWNVLEGNSNVSKVKPEIGKNCLFWVSGIRTQLYFILLLKHLKGIGLFRKLINYFGESSVVFCIVFQGNWRHRTDTCQI